MNKKIYKIIVVFIVVQMLLTTISPMVAYANDAVVLEALIEPMTKTYKVDIVDDKPVWFGNHKEQKFINFDSYYNTICADASNGSSLDGDVLAKNPTTCFSLDSNVDLTYSDSSSGNLVTGRITDAYDMYMSLEGFRDSNGLQVDDSEKGKVEGAGIAKSSPFILNIDKSHGLKALTFPSSHSGGDNVTEAETEYAIEVGNTLSTNINSMLSFINSGKKFKSVTELVNKSILIRPTKHNFTIVKGTGTNSSKNYIILYGTPESYGDPNNNPIKTVGMGRWENVNTGNASNFANSFWKDGDYPNADANGNLLVYVIPTTQADISYGNILNQGYINSSEIASFVWAMPKGYIKINGVPNSLKFTDENHNQYRWASERDIPWITMHNLTMYANNAYKNFNESISTKDANDGAGNAVMEIIVGIVKAIINGLRSILGLSDTYSLVYNKGARGSSAYNYGAMPDTWWTVVLRYHIIFQSLAWFIIIVGLIKTLIDLNLSTINPGKRMHVYKTIERFIVVGFGLVLIIPICQFLLSMNDSIVKIFATQVDPNASSPPVIGTLAGLILQLAYFGIVVYINFTYIMRSIIIGILIVTSPYFISSMAFSDNNRQLFSSWARELLANIFMQSIHAFSLAFLTNLVSTGGGLENLVVSYSIIPLTELVRNLVFQGAGSHAGELGKSAGAKYMNMAQGASSVVGSYAVGKASSMLSKSNEVGDTSLSDGAKSGGKGAAKGMESPAQGLSNAIDSRMTGIKNAADFRAADDNAGDKDKAKANRAKAGASAIQAGLAGASAVGSVVNAAWDMAKGELTHDNSQYSSAGSNIVKAGGSGLKSMARAGQSMGSMAENIGSTGKHLPNEESTREDLNAISRSANVTMMPSRVNQDPKTGLNVAKFNGSSRGNAVYSNNGKELIENIGAAGISSMVNSNSQFSPFYKDVQKVANPSTSEEVRKEIQNRWQPQGISISGSDDGGAKITYGEKYFRDNKDYISATASQDGKSFYARTGGKPTAFGAIDKSSTYNQRSGQPDITQNNQQ